MKAIGFKSFRNFEEFPMMPINGVTFLVGQNNSGKSTLTKACRIIDGNVANFLRYWSEQSISERPYIDFSTTCFSFHRALFAGASNGELELTSQLGYFDVTIHVCPSTTNPAKGDVCYIKIYDTIDDVYWEYDFNKKLIKWDYSGLLLANILRCKLCQENRYFVGNNDAETEKLIKMYEEHKERIIVTIETDRYEPFSFGPILWNKSISLDGKSMNINFEKLNLQKKGIFENWGIISNFFCKLRKDLDNCSNKTIYFQAHESTLKSLFSIIDSQDATSRVIIDFHFSNEKMKATRKKWINRWLAQLGIGTDFEMTAIDEAINVKIITLQGYSIPLADMGRGAVQIFIALLRVSLLPSDVKWSNLGKDFDDLYVWHPDLYPGFMADESFPLGWKRECSVNHITLIFEEPEQNLHPALQSKLADLFADIHKKFGYNVIVETHSEYMIRRTQALIASDEVPFEKNPFHVYYFPQGELPYDMEYKENGLFINKFGSGFFDEAGKSQMDIIRRVKEAQHV